MFCLPIIPNWIYSKREVGLFEEIRIRDQTGAYRVIYTARMGAAIYVLHAFQKKTQATAQRDLDLAKKRFTQLTNEAT